MQRSKELGQRSEMFTAEKQPHAFFHKSPWKEKTLQRADEFLVSLGYLQGKATIKVPDAKDVQPKKDPPKKTPDANGLKVGEEMPVHVVTFIAGARKDGAGCPSIMM